MGLALAALLAWAAFALPASASSLFLRLTDIDGESRDKTHFKWCELTSFSLGISRADGAPASFSDLNVSKKVDAASVKLNRACATGDHIDQAILEVVADSGTGMSGGPLVAYRANFTNVLVTSVQAGGANETLGETVSLNFASFDWSVPLLDALGKETNRLGVQWDIVTATGKSTVAVHPSLVVRGQRLPTGTIRLLIPAVSGESFQVLGSARLDGGYAPLRTVTASATGDLVSEFAADAAMQFFLVVRNP